MNTKLEAQFICEHMGHAIYFSHISYYCPSLKLYGYSSERAIKNAIRKKLSK